MIKHLCAVLLAASAFMFSNQTYASFHPDPDTCTTGRLCDAVKECKLYRVKYGNNERLFNILVQNSGDPLVREHCTIDGFAV